ncbi:MAG TPA: hypothetical protein VLV31_03195 [Candidatus Acidoferrales bacterium]|nr:hypothetical protein [Candidatus Acidoferrales bacterium]
MIKGTLDTGVVCVSTDVAATMMYTFAARIVAEEEALGAFGDFARKLGTTVCALRDDQEILDGYFDFDPDVLVLSVRSRVNDLEGQNESLRQNDLWYYSTNKMHLQQVKKRISERLRKMKGELKQGPIVSDVYELASVVSA